jgi:hypothetical protein
MPQDYQTARKALNARGIHHGAADRELAKMGFDIGTLNPHKSGGFSKVGGAIGDVVGKVAPAAGLIPGVGPLAAGALTLGSKALGKLNDPGGLGGMKLFEEGIAPAALAGGAAYGMDKLGGAGGIASKVFGGGGGGVASQIFSKGGMASDIGGFIKNNPELILGGLSAVQGMRKSSQAGDLQRQALDQMQATQRSRQPLMDAVLAGLGRPSQGVNLDRIFANSSNPYRRPGLSTNDQSSAEAARVAMREGR